ncbi:HAMP domain-containing sensor histidine kinase [Bacillus sp. FJAT-47783]|uniref:HAMP domain-containing sensor histidine kinase n=1 Tax=Bacillus sp. FJAT-47783 TaxID=2922712 RepID=UPI001FAE23E4|nr:HAMP domain-containing sensor histidine kinase [Bacillus sp. FJAT-47783]
MKKRVVFQFMIIILLVQLLSIGIFRIAATQYYYNGIAKTILGHAESASSLISIFQEERFYQLQKGWNGEVTREIIDTMNYPGATLQVVSRDGRIIQSSSGFSTEGLTVKEIKSQSNDSSFHLIEESTTGEKILSVYSPLIWKGQTVGYLRYITSLKKVNQVLLTLNIAAVMIGMFVSILVFFISLKLANSIVKPIEKIISVSSKMAGGNFKDRMDENYPDELGTLAKTLNTMADEIVRSEKLKNEFISSISHELRTPLTGIKGWSETLKNPEGLSKKDIENGLNLISVETDRMILLVEDLLDFSRLQNHKIKLRKEKVNVEHLLNDVIMQLSKKAEDKLLRLDFDVEDQVISVDPNRMKQVFLNILDNAIKFSNPHGRISIQSNITDNEFSLSIKDEGIGVDSKHLPYLTKSFYQVSQQQGAGLGLSIASEIIELHGGSMKIASQKGHGTTVTVTIPISEKV